ncbi:MAG: antibiotic biosynthesis monooxygenase family protein [Propionicimonas sp.]|nr:antibiotic biosynthesis monooxygenase family protein [Propionicimonas sp.]
MLAISRFRVQEEAIAGFAERARTAVAYFASCPGCEQVDLLRNLDDPELWTITSRWVDVGSYRRSFNGYEAKLVLVPLLSEAIDEPSAYATADEVGENLPRFRD